MSIPAASVECVTLSAPPPSDNERDPLAWEAVDPQPDPLAVERVVKKETGVARDVTVPERELTEDDLLNSDEDTNDKVNQNHPNVPDIISKPIISELTDKPEIKLLTEEEAKANPYSRKSSTNDELKKQIISSPELEKPKIAVDVPSAIENKIERNGTAEKNSEAANVAENPDYHRLNGDRLKVETTRKRSSDQPELSQVETPSKKLCQEIEKSFLHSDNMINDYIGSSTNNNLDEIKKHTDQLVSEIQTLRDLAQKKEHEWNNILHLKKVKEEILLRLLRKKQVISYENNEEVNGNDFIIDKSDELSGLSIKPQSSSLNLTMPITVTTHSNHIPVLPPPYEKSPIILPKPIYSQPILMPGPRAAFGMDMNGQHQHDFMHMGYRGPIKDVKSIIADYRQKHPESTPRRGRRMKSILNQTNNPRPIAPKVEGNNLGMMLNNLDVNQKSVLERLSQVQAGALPTGVSFKDVLVQLSNMQQQQQQQQSGALGLLATRQQLGNNMLNPQRQQDNVARSQNSIVTKNHTTEPPRVKNERLTAHEVKSDVSSPQRLPPPPPYPEISLHPVVSSSHPEQGGQNSSLLHGILTKQASSATQTFSPTLAQLLKSPERKHTAPSCVQVKNCGEITIIPVQPKHSGTGSELESPSSEHHPPEVVQLDDEESAPSESEAGEAEGSSGEGASRLVIDEGNSSGEVPPCQGCRRRDAQFVCAGCANQWYCSRDCQVAAWDEHSDMCSG